jgi:putative membrane-bound dehydrogenase-like protein
MTRPRLQKTVEDQTLAHRKPAMKLFSSLLLVALIACSLFAAVPYDEVIPHRQDEPPNEPYSPQEALERMTVPDGFRVDLVASEPDLVNPVAMTFDDRGRIWVTESLEYPRKPAGRGRDRVKILEDTDGDGRADKFTVFADGLNIPTGVAVGYGGVWVVNAPELLFLREKDGKEISREVVLTGFGRTDTHELPNSLTWGPDGWLYGLNGVFNQCSVQSNNGRRYDFTCALWRVHPRTHEFQVVAEGTSNPYGLGWDSEGSAIVEACHWANDHLFHFVETGHYQRQAGAFPAFAMPLGSITDHSHQKTAYCGLAVLDTETFPPQYRELICIGNIHGGCLNLDRLHRDGSTYLATAEPDLLTANDAWFMPVSIKVGPDGCLYILDWYDRYHCSQDAARDPAGVDRLKGRLYRLSYGDAPRTLEIDLAAEGDDQLIARLASGNIFFRESAQRILTERLSGDGVAQEREKLRGKLESLAAGDGGHRTARLHALWALIGSGSLEPSFHERMLTHDDATFRAWAVRAAGNFGKVSSAIRATVATLARDSSRDVQLQVAIASRKIEGCDALPILMDVLAQCGNDKVIPAIAWQNLHPLLETESARLVDLLTAIRGEKTPPAVATLLPRFIERMLNTREPDAAAVAALLEFAAQHAPDRAPECIAAVSANLSGLNDDQFAELKQQLHPVLEKLRNDPRSATYPLSVELLAGRLGLISIDASAVRGKFASDAEPESVRLEALEALIAFRDEQLLEALPAVLMSASPEFSTRVLAALGRVENPRLADVVLAAYTKLAPEVQPLAVDLLMQREPWARKLLDAVLQGNLPKGVLNANHLRKILESNDREALWAVEKAFGRIREERNPDRERVVAEMAEYLRANVGDPVAGQQVFKNLCGQCHTIYGQGGQVGPDITSNGRASFEQLLSNVFDPSLVIGPDYQVVTVVTKDGRNLTGLVVENNDQRIVLRMAGATDETVPRNNVEYTRISKLSMMPEGVESIFSKQDLADLFAYLSLDKPPSDSTAKPIPGAPALPWSHKRGTQGTDQGPGREPVPQDPRVSPQLESLPKTSLLEPESPL